MREKMRLLRYSAYPTPSRPIDFLNWSTDMQPSLLKEVNLYVILRISLFFDWYMIPGNGFRLLLSLLYSLINI